MEKDLAPAAHPCNLRWIPIRRPSDNLLAWHPTWHPTWHPKRDMRLTLRKNLGARGVDTRSASARETSGTAAPPSAAACSRARVSGSSESLRRGTGKRRRRPSVAIAPRPPRQTPRPCRSRRSRRRTRRSRRRRSPSLSRRSSTCCRSSATTSASRQGWDTGESLRSSGGVRGPRDGSFGAFADGLTGDSSPVSIAIVPPEGAQTSDDATPRPVAFRRLAVPPIEGFVGFIATGATRLAWLSRFWLERGRGASVVVVVRRRRRHRRGGQPGGGPSSFSSRRRGPWPPPAAAGQFFGVALALGAAPGAAQDTQRWELGRVVDVYPRQPAPGLGRR